MDNMSVHSFSSMCSQSSSLSWDSSVSDISSPLDNSSINSDRSTEPNLMPLMPVKSNFTPQTPTEHPADPYAFPNNSEGSSPKSPISLVDSSPDFKRRIHKCPYSGCKKVYTKSSHLKAHLRTHTGQSNRQSFCRFLQGLLKKVLNSKTGF